MQEEQAHKKGKKETLIQINYVKEHLICLTCMLTSLCHKAGIKEQPSFSSWAMRTTYIQNKGKKLWTNKYAYIYVFVCVRIRRTSLSSHCQCGGYTTLNYCNFHVQNPKSWCGAWFSKPAYSVCCKYWWSMETSQLYHRQLYDSSCL